MAPTTTRQPEATRPETHVRIFDADNHMYETTEAFTKFLPKEYRKVIQYVDVRGRTKIAVNGAISEYIPNPTFEYVAPPGAMEEYFRNGNTDGRDMREIYGQPMESIPAFREPAARLELMDEQGVERSLMFPTLASLLEERLRDDPDATHVVIHALNEWMHETWTFDYEHRIYSTPVITLPVVDRAIEELDWVLERGARAVLIRPAPVPDRGGSRSMAMPEYDPFWQRVVDSGVLVAFHASDSGYDRYTNDWLGDTREFLPFQPNPFRMFSMWRPIEDTVASLVCHGTLTRFPDLKFAIVENGASWVAPLLDKFGELWKKMPQTFDEHPVEAIKRALHISPFWEEDLPALAELLGEDNVLFGSDYPHPEGMANPRSYLDELSDVDDELRRKLMGGNLANLMGLEAAPV